MHASRLATSLTSLLLAACLFAAAPSRAQDGYLAGIEDLPLMEGLVEDSDAGLVFDKPSGRIVEAVASGDRSTDEVIAFYAATLPGLGWTPAPVNGDGGTALGFSREGEHLVITVERSGGGAVVRYSLAPSDTTP